MSELQRLLSDPRFRSADKIRYEPSAAPEASPGSMLRVVCSMHAQTRVPTPQSPPQDWDALIHRVQAAARRAREIEAQAREREERIEHVLERVREDINTSNERARIAEMQASEAQVRAEAQVIAAEARALVAEERTRTAEAWLGRVQDAIMAEFTDLTEPSGT